ncbi:hypothetical protein LCGC14_2104320 [marine sediment metagenome]|uniref:Uncharacterized protein n=1 Tax=marine sediment metagenome TaxID=412755 RepID=A0A0F9EW73_9ZZZZ
MIELTHKTMKIKEINHSIAYFNETNTGKYIEINKHLKKYPKLYAKVMLHESKHASTEGFWPNILIDIKDMFDIHKQLMLFAFMLKHPSSIRSLIPFFFENKRVSVNWFMLYFMLFMFLVSFVIVYNIWR